MASKKTEAEIVSDDDYPPANPAANIAEESTEEDAEEDATASDLESDEESFARSNVGVAEEKRDRGNTVSDTKTDAVGSEAVKMHVVVKRNWSDNKLALLLLLEHAIRSSKITQDQLCALSTARTTQAQTLPVKGMFEVGDNLYAIRLAKDETRPVQFGDRVFKKGDPNPWFVVSEATSVSATEKVYRIKMASEPNDDIPRGREVDIRPFSLAPIPAVCKQTSRAQTLETWLAAYENQADAKPLKQTNFIAYMFQKLGKKNVNTTLQDDTEPLLQAMIAFFNHYTKTDCPNPLVDGKCVDSAPVTNADRSSAIRPFKDFESDVKNLEVALTAKLVDEEEFAHALCSNLLVSQAYYEQIMRENVKLWNGFASQNLQIKTICEFLLRMLIRHCLMHLDVRFPKVTQEIARLWLQFYVAMPSFYFAMSKHIVLKYANVTTNELRNDAHNLVRHFGALLQGHLNSFLPVLDDNGADRRHEARIVREIHNQFETILRQLSHFKYQPIITNAQQRA